MPQVDWQRIDNEARFRSFCAKLLHEEIGRRVNIYDRPGRDYCIDGDFEGTYDDETGKWVFQFKCYHEFKPLKAKMKKEVRDIQRHRSDVGRGSRLWEGVTHYRLLTTVKFSPQNHDDILEILAALNLNCDIWFKEKLESMCMSHPFVLHYFFGVDNLLLWPTPEARDVYQGRRLIGSYFSSEELPYIARDEIDRAFDDFLASPDAWIMELTGPPGVGKSRAMLQQAERIDEEGERKAFFAFPAEVSLDGHLDELPPDGNCTIFVEDPEKCVYLAELLRYITRHTDYRGRFKIVLAASQTPLRQLTPELRDCYSQAESRELRLEPSHDIVKQLLASLRLEERTIASIAQMAHGLPVWAVLAADAIRRGEPAAALTSQQQVADDYIDNYVEALLDRVQDPELIRTTLAAVAALQPIDLTNPEFIDAVGQLGNAPSHEANAAVQSAGASELLTTHGRLTGIVPEVLASQLLIRCFYGDAGQPTGFHERAIRALRELNPAALFGNLARAETLGGRPLLDDVIAHTGREIAQKNNIERLAVLKSLASIVPYRPTEYLGLCESILDTPQPDVAHEYEFLGLKGRQPITHKDLAHEIVNDIGQASFSIRALARLMRLVARIAAENQDDALVSQESERLLREVSEHGVNKPLSFSERVLDVLAEWAEDVKGAPDHLRAKAHLALVMLGSILNPEFTDNVYDPSKMSVTLRRMSMRPSHSMVSLWQRATDVAMVLTAVADPDIATEAVTALGEALGAADRARPSQEDDEHYESWVRESDRRFELLRQLAEKDLPSRVLNAIENGVEWRAAYGPEEMRGAALEVVGLLEKHADYRLFRGLVGQTRLARGEFTVAEAAHMLLKQPAAEAASALVRVLGAPPPGCIFGMVRGTFWRIGAEEPDYAQDLYSAIITNEPAYELMVNYLGDLLAPLRASRPEFALSEIERLAASDAPQNWLVAARTYAAAAQRDLAAVVPTDGDVALFSKLVAREDRALQQPLLTALPKFADTHGAFFEQTLLQFAGRVTNASAQHVLAAACLGNPFATGVATHPWVKPVLSEFVRLPDLEKIGSGFYQLARLLSEIAQTDPLWVVDFFEARLDAGDQDDTGDYHPVPFDLRDIFDNVDQSLPAYADALRKVRAWSLQPALRLLNAPRVFQHLSMPEGLRGTAGTILREWMVAKDPEKLRNTASLLREFELDEALADLTADIIEAAAKLLPDEKRRVETELACAIGSYGVQRIPEGAPPPHAAAQVRLFRELRKRRPTPAIVSFCDRMISAAKQDIASERERDEEIRYW